MSATHVVGTPSMARLNINGSGGSETAFDIRFMTTHGGVESLVPWSRIDIRSFNNLDIQWAGVTGEIVAGRYNTLLGGAANSIDGPGSFGVLYFRGGTAAADIVEIAVYR